MTQNKLAIIELPAFQTRFLEHAPFLKAYAGKHSQASLMPCLPALTIPGHASIATGVEVSDHGIVANGWFFREHNEVMMWRQSEQLVKAESIWDAAKKRDPDFSSFKHFWWPGMASSCDTYCNVRPAYFADGRKSGLHVNLPIFVVVRGNPSLDSDLRARCKQRTKAFLQP